MKISNEQKLFVVQFGKPDSGGWISYSSSNGLSDVYVIAKNYDEAGEKALEYANIKNSKESVVDEIGSLKNIEPEIKIKAIKLACEEFIY